MTRLKVAELTSGVRALVLGVGLGALFPLWFGAAAGSSIVAGGRPAPDWTHAFTDGVTALVRLNKAASSSATIGNRHA
jgi:hypothetical protein